MIHPRAAAAGAAAAAADAAAATAVAAAAAEVGPSMQVRADPFAADYYLGAAAVGGVGEAAATAAAATAAAATAALSNRETNACVFSLGSEIDSFDALVDQVDMQAKRRSAAAAFGEALSNSSNSRSRTNRTVRFSSSSYSSNSSNSGFGSTSSSSRHRICRQPGCCCMPGAVLDKHILERAFD